jgi:hypothetical protein
VSGGAGDGDGAGAAAGDREGPVHGRVHRDVAGGAVGAALDREWDGITARRGYPMVSIDNNTAERVIRGPVVTRKNARLT